MQYNTKIERGLGCRPGDEVMPGVHETLGLTLNPAGMLLPCGDPTHDKKEAGRSEVKDHPPL